MCVEKSADTKEFCCDWDSAAARDHELLVSVCCVIKVREELKNRAADTLVKLRKI